MRRMAASCRDNQGSSNVPLNRVRVFVSRAAIVLAALAAFPLYAHAATGDGKIVYGESGTGIIRERNYTNSTNAVAAESNATTTATVVNWAIIEASPQADQYIAVSLTDTADDTLYISRYESGSWTLDVTQTGVADAVTFRRADVGFESDTGNPLVVYSNGGTTNEISYYYRYCDTGAGTCAWIGPCTLNSNRTTGAVEWVELEARPSGGSTHAEKNEMTLVFSDANDDLSAFVWSPTTELPNPANCTTIGAFWADEPAAALSTTLATTNSKKFDVAYEGSSGDVMVAWYNNATADLNYSTNPGSSTGWTGASNTTFANAGTDIDLCTRPSSDNIGLASVTNSTTSADTETAIWTGSAWGNIDTDRDITAEENAFSESIACGWVGTTGNLVVAYADVATNGDLDWILWNGSTWAAQTDVAVSSGTESERHFRVKNFPGENKILVTMLNNAATPDLWSVRYDNSSWTVHDGDTGTGGTQALETSASILTYGSVDAALTAFSVTPVAEVLTMAAQKVDDRVKLAWNTKTESQVEGYNVLRALQRDEKGNKLNELKFERVTDKPLAARGGNMAGEAYEWTDGEAKSNAEYVYRIEVLGKNNQVMLTLPPIQPDATGRVTYVDPKSGQMQLDRIDKPVETPTRTTRAGDTVSLGAGKNGFGEAVAQQQVTTLGGAGSMGGAGRGGAMFGGVKRKKIAAPLKPVDAIKAVKAIEATVEKSLVSAGPTLKFSIDTPGLYRVTGADLAAAGWDLAKIDPTTLTLVSRGHNVPIRLIGLEDKKFDTTDAMEFVGEIPQSRYYKTNMFFLSQVKGGGARMRDQAAETAGGNRPSTYRAHARKQGNEAYYSESPSDAHWFFETELLSPVSLDIPLTIDHPVATSEPAKLTVGMQGLSMYGFADPNHNRQRILVYVNDELVGEHAWNFDLYVTPVLDVPSELLVDGINTVKLEAVDEAGDLEQYVLADFVDLEYSRGLYDKTGGLFFEPETPAKATYVIHQHPEAEAAVYALRADGSADFIKGPEMVKEAGGYQVRFTDKTKAGDRYLVIGSADRRSPVSIVADRPSDLKKENLPNYLVIAPQLFHESLKDFVSHRKGKLIDLQDIYDEYSSGLPEPEAIRAFLLDAAKRGSGMCLLVGDGHFDYRDFQGSGVPEYVPVALVPSKFGETISDSWFATIPGEIVPRLAIGRWPVQTTEQVQTMIAKTLAYENSSNPGGSVMVSDDEPVFRSTLDRLVEVLPQGISNDRLDYGDMDSVSVKADLVNAINQGRGLVTYAGHGGIQLWSSAQLFTVADIDFLTNAGHYPVLVALGCLSGYFGHPEGMDSLVERLVLEADKGVVAALSPSSLTSTPEQQELSQAWLSSLVQDHHLTMGEALLRANAAAAQLLNASDAQAVIQTFNLLGDPALTLKLD